MKKINLPTCIKTSLTFTSENLSDPIPLTSVDIKSAAADIEIVRENGGQILYAVIDISQALERIISNYLFGASIYPPKKKQFFKNEILESPNITFQFKKELFKKIVKNKTYLKGKKKNQIFTKLDDIIKWRNAFAHGEIIFDSEKECTLHYYSNGKKELVLDSFFWNSVEKTFKELKETLKIINESQEKIQKEELLGA